MHDNSMPITSRPSRRLFLQLAGAGAAATLAGTGSTLAAQPKVKPAAAPGSSKKVPFELAVASYTFKDFPLEQALAMTKRVGLTKICLKSFHLPMDATPEQIAAAVAKSKEAGVSIYGGGVIGMRNEAETNNAFQYAKAAGMTTIVAKPLPEVLPLIDKKVKQFDICVAIHNHGPGDKVYPTPESAYEKIKTLDKRIGLCVDIGHTVRIGADPVRAVKDYADRLLDVHIKDESEATPAGKTIEIGRGVIDIPAFLRALIEIKYNRVVGFEFEKDPKDPLAGLAESVGYVNGVLAVI